MSQNNNNNIRDILKKYTEIQDLTSQYKDEDKDYGCFFGASRPKYEGKSNEGTYHHHEFTIRINGSRLWICKNHLKLLMKILKELKE